ncbi:MAG: TIR domain-containing protein [Pseudomonadales bacterium]
MTTLNVNTDIIHSPPSNGANALSTSNSKYHLLSYPNDSDQLEALPRLLFTCDTDQDLPFVTSFCELYAQHFNCTIVEPFCKQSTNRIDYVRWLTTEQGLAKNTVVVALVGPTTSTCANVDWDIAAALTEAGNGIAGLVGIMLPHYFDMASEVRNLRIIPHRLSDNTISGYATLYTWQHVMKSLYNVQVMVQAALKASRMSLIQPINKLPLKKP